MTDFYKFIGQNGSLGLKKGTYYVVRIRRYPFTKKVLAYIYDNGEKEGVTCPYTSIDTFNKNWVRM